MGTCAQGTPTCLGPRVSPEQGPTSHSPAVGQRGRLVAPPPARCAQMQKPEPLEAPGRVLQDPPGTRAESALGTGLPRHRRRAGTRCATRGMRAGLALTWARGARGRGGGRYPLRDVPLLQRHRSWGTRGGRGDRPLAHSLRPCAEPRLRARPLPLPSPPRPVSPFGMHRVPDVVSAAPEPTSSAWV